jgi:DNA-binding beta-propeller fold protein YncE
MSKSVLARSLLFLTVGLVLCGCGMQGSGGFTPQVTAVAPASPQAAPPLASQSPVATFALPLPTSAPTSGPDTAVQPSALPATPFSLGVRAGDAYDLASLAVDSAGQRAYVYAQDSAGDPVVSVVDLAQGEVLRLISLSADGNFSDGQVLLSPDGAQGYAVSRYAAVLTLFDPHTGALGPKVNGVAEALLSADGERLYALTKGGGLSAFATTDLRTGSFTPQWEVNDAPYEELAVNGGVLAAIRGGAQPALVTFDAATGRQTGSAPLADGASALAPGPNGGWLISSGYNPARLVRLDAGLKIVAEAEALSGTDPYYDAPRARYLTVGWEPDGGGQVIMAYAEDDLTPTAVLKGERADVPDVFAPYGKDMLLGLRRNDGARLSFLDPVDLASTRDVILGVKLVDMALDETSRRLYVADDQDRIHVLGLPQGDVRAVWDGAAPIALDATNRRLYVNRASGVVALDSTSGEELARFPQSGMPAPDPNRDLVYIADAGVMIYDRSGAQVGRLDSTFPVERGMNPNPFAFAARVNPANGVLVATFTNGSPGSSNRSYLRLYPPQADRPITITGPFTFVSDVAFDPGGDLLVSYSNAMNMEALQRLDSNGNELGRLGGRTGKLALDPTTGLLYVAGGGALARVHAATMQLSDLHRGPSEVGQLLLHPGLGQLYARSEDSSRITVLNPEKLQPIVMRSAAADGLPLDADVSALDFLEAGGELILYATTSTGDHYRVQVPPNASGPELGWERLPVGSLPAWGHLTVADDALFRAGSGEYGADGVFLSRDGGSSWELLASGLVDLRPAQPVLARTADEAYFVGKTGGVLAWRPGMGSEQGQWERILPPARDNQSLGELSLAPDGTLFLVSWDRARRSTDGGRNWSDLPLPGDGIKIAGFDPDYARTRTLFSVLCGSDSCQVLRSQDGGETHQAVLALPSYSYPVTLLARAGRGELYLYAGGYPAPQLYRSLDRGASWQAADLAAIRDTTSMAVAPDGRLWFGRKGLVRAVDPAEIGWSAVTPSPSLPVSPSPLPPPSPVPSPTPCARHLPELGCPTSSEVQVSMARQPFQRGGMIWIGPSSSLPDLEKTILVLADEGGTWQRFPDLWQEGQPESDPAITAPGGLMQPVRGFGKTWRESLGGAGSVVGWAIAPEVGLTGGVQRYENGWLLRLDDEQVVLTDAGTWRAEQ